MSLEDSVKETCLILKSARATDRKKSAEKLKDFLTRNAVPSLLTNNTLNKSGYTWNHIFDDINDYIIKETEKFETSKTFYTITAPLCTSLLHLCVTNANKGYAYIKCERITEACLIILQDSRLTRAIGDAYLNLLYKYVLPNDYYLGYITPATWESLLNICITACHTKSSQLDDLTKIKLMWLVIQNASHCCQFAIPLRDSLSKLKKCLETLNEKRVQEFVMKIIILLLDMLSLESRLTMCGFSEMILPMIFKFYEQSMEEKKKSIFFKLLKNTISIHHPLSRMEHENGALASDWFSWNKHLYSILEIICLEVNYAQKPRKLNENLTYCHNFYETAALVFYQIFNKTEEDTKAEAGNSAKKQKLTFNKNKSFTDLVEELRQNSVPWVGILLEYVKKFNYSISNREYILLFEVLENILSANREVNWDHFEDITCLVIKHITSHPDYKIKDDHKTFMTLWNNCIRNATLLNSAHNAIHRIVQVILCLVPMKYQNAQPLLVSYLEKGMPVNNYSLKTINFCLNKFYTKSCNLDVRRKCFSWLINDNISILDSEIINEFLIRIICNENLPIIPICDIDSSNDVYNVIFFDIEKSILFSEFEYEVPKRSVSTTRIIQDSYEINHDMYNVITVFLEQHLTKTTESLAIVDIKCIELTKLVFVTTVFLNSLLKHNLMTRNDIQVMSLYFAFQKALRHMYTGLTHILKSDVQIRHKVVFLKCAQDILMKEYDSLINTEVRKHIDENCFHCINDIIKRDIAPEEGETYYENDIEFSAIGLKQNSIYFLATYCRKRSMYTEEILKCILDRDLYNFTYSFEIDCAFRCVEIVNNVTIEYLDLIFSFMQDLCRDLFRKPEATRGLLKILDQMLERIWTAQDDVMRQNCLIMIKGYLQRNAKMAPDVAAIVYKLVAKIINYNKRMDMDLHSSFEEALIEKIKGDHHSVRLYCCHLLTLIAIDLREEDIEHLSDNLREIFVINVTDNKKSVLKDESINRTITVLHSFYNLATVRTSSIHDIIIKVLLFQNEKVMDKNMVKKMLSLLTENVLNIKINSYMNINILRVLYYWLKNSIGFDKLPLHLFGCESFDDWFEKHIKWLISTDILWRHNGKVEDSAILQQLKSQTRKSDEDMIEMCFCNIILLCLPYIVIEKYKLANEREFNSQSAESANRMFHSTRHILKNERWSNLFVENLGELLLLIVTHLNDSVSASKLFEVQVLNKSDYYTYSENVFTAILKFFGELIDGNIMQYLCENQPLVILNILFKLWDNVLREKVFDLKVLIFHAFMTFVGQIPLGYISDALLCNFLCNSIAHAISDSHSNEEVKIFVEGLKIVITKIFSQTPKMSENIQRSTLSKIVSILNIKIEKGYVECESLLRYITKNLKQYLTESLDVVDYISLMTDDVISPCSTSKHQFFNEFGTYLSSLTNASQNTLFKICNFLKQNKRFLKELYFELDVKGFSEDCKNSLIHKAIFALTTILKSEDDEKIVVEACNCLAEIGTYDIKTLVTVPPADTSRIKSLNPKQYFATLVLQSLSQHLFDEDPTVSNKVTAALNRLLKFRDGKEAMDMVNVEKETLKSLVSTNPKNYAEFIIDKAKYDKYKAVDYWLPYGDESHSQWITRITLALLDMVTTANNYLNSLTAVCTVKPKFCQNIMPGLFGLILYCSSDAHAEIFGEQIDQVFKYIWDLSYDANFENSGVSNGCEKSNKLDRDQKLIVEYLLEVVDLVRIQMSHYKTRTQSRSSRREAPRADPLNFLRLQYARVAGAGAAAGRQWAALYYGECAAHCGEPGNDHVLRIFRKCYVSIGEMDAIDGCGIAHLTSDVEKRKHLINTGQFTDSLLLHDIALSRGNIDEELMYGAVTSLHKSGMHHLALQYIKSYPESDKLDDIKYDCLANLGDWSDIVDISELVEKSKTDICNQETIIKTMRYACLKDCINVQTTTEVSNKLQLPLNQAKLSVAKLCLNLNVENCQSVYKIIANLHLLRDIESYFSVRCDRKAITELMDEWRVNNIPIFNDFKNLEAIISQRSLILEHIAKSDSVNFANLNELQLQYAELGLKNNRIQMAQRIVAAVGNLEMSKKVVLLESQIAWAKGHRDIALSLLHSIVTQESDDVKLTAMSLRQYGLWMAESKRETARDIIEKYLEKSLKVLSGNGDVDTRLKVYYDIAQFADAEYRQVVSYMNSSVFENKVKCVESMKGTAETLKSSQRSAARREEKVVIMTKYRVNNTFRELDEIEISNIKAEKESFLKLAMRYYLLSLKQSDENNLSVFRVISLWLDNPGLDFDDEETGHFGQLLHSIPSWKFITVLPQLAPRLSNETTAFAEHLRQILTRCARDHPHHTLPILLSLKNSEAGEGAGAEEGGEARVRAAAALLRALARRPLAALLEHAQLLCDAIISFAYCVPESKDLKPQAVPKSELISKIGNLNEIPIPTDTVPIRKDCDYSGLSTIISFEKYFELVGGVNYPKKISCLSSDGKNRILLIKGRDDLRQDAVMQQVFNIVNTLLKNSPITKQNKLLIRTYKVVPMSRRSGVLQWCEGTIPVGSYLVSAHIKYRPQDMSPAAARAKLKDCHDQRKPNKYKTEVFKEILKVFKPIFHYFFTEHYLNPVTWYERRLAYTRSVAASSMVGYILGLGDRHVQNILIDKTTAELIHIDFGIAFDQGKTLPTPETVPFRLTQDIIAGFGSSGVEGTFRRCCEKTLQLLRDNQETLLTILEVLLYDPLYLWIIPTNPNDQATSSRAGSAGGAAGAGLAERALRAVRGKLCGAEGGAGGVSVPGHVARLLRAAADPANLAALFPGWQPYL